MLSHFLRAARTPSISYITNLTSNTSTADYSFNMSGNQPAGLYVIGIIAENASVSTITLDSVLFNGNNTTNIRNTRIVTGANGTLIGAIVTRKLTNAASGPGINITFNAEMSRCNVSVWRIDNNRNDTVFTSATSSISGTASNRTNTVNSLQYGAVGVSILANGNNASTSWTNATERYDQPFGTGTGGSGADFQAEAEGSRTITATATSGTNDGLVLVTGVWR